MSILFLGLDAGGSKTAVVAAREGSDELFEMVGTAANLQRLGADATASVLSDLIRHVAERHTGVTSIKACVGIAGAGRPEDARSVSEKSRRLLAPDLETNLLVVHDGEIALDGAFRGESGAVVIAGTGSIILARTRMGQLVRAGGWGYLLGDEGSGYAIGLAGIRAVAAAMDSGDDVRLAGVLSDEHGFATRDDIIRAVYRDHFPVQTIAPAVLRLAAEQDEVCLGIVVAESRLLASQLAASAGRRSDVEPRAALVGGLTRSETYVNALSSSIVEALPHWRVVEPLAPPAVGALERARRL